MGKSILTRLGGIGLAIVVALGIYFVRSKGEDKIEQAQAPDVGECVHFEKDGANDKPVDATCGTAESSHKVVADDGNCGPGETSYRVSRGSGGGSIVELCLILDAKKGDCFDTSDESKVDCAASKNESTVVKIASVGKAGAKCANPGQPIEFTKQDVLLCLVPNA